MVTVKNLENGQRVATKGDLQITQTIINGQRFNDCSDGNELISSGDERLKELFIALAQYR